MRPKVCRICLLSNIKRTEAVDEILEEFHDELCDYDVFQNASLTICPICEYLLKKFYNFKLKCERAHKLLKKWKKKKVDLENLLTQIPPSSLGFSPRNPTVIEIKSWDLKAKLESSCLCLSEQDHNSLIPDVPIKDEISDSQFVELESQEIILNDLYTDDNGIDDDSQIENQSDQEIKSKESFNYTKDNCVELDLKNVNELSELDTLSGDEIEQQQGNVQFKNELSSHGDVSSIKSENKKRTETGTTKKGDLTDPSTIKKGSKVQFKNEMSSHGDVSSIKSENKKHTEPGTAKKGDLIDPRTIKKGSMICKNQEKLKNRVLELMEQGEFKDLGSNITIDKDMFVRMFEKCNLKVLKDANVLPGRQGPSEIPKMKKLLKYLYSRYHPKYEAVFKIEYLNTESKKLAEFEARRNGREYLDAEYKCDICFKAFEAESKLKHHNKRHDSSQPYECVICKMRARTGKTLANHYRSNHCAVYRCKLCPMVTYDFGTMVNHYDQHNGVEYLCPVCTTSFRTKSAMNHHRAIVHKTSHICPLCARSFVSDMGLHFHMKHKHRDASVTATVSCELCSAKLATQEALQKHLFAHHKSTRRNRLICGPCKMVFNTVEELKQHRVSQGHIQVARQRQWYLKSGKTKSCDNVWGPDKPSRTCPVCLVEVENVHRLSLYKHYQAVHPQEPYTAHANKLEHLCEICGKGFRARCLYLDHMNAHAGLRPHECTECEAKFPSLTLLWIHKARHRPPRYKCKDCGKLFITTSNLFNHRRTHIGDRRYKCDICFKGFLHRSTLNEHVRGVHHQIRRVKKTSRKLNT